MAGISTVDAAMRGGGKRATPRHNKAGRHKLYGSSPRIVDNDARMLPPDALAPAPPPKPKLPAKPAPKAAGKGAKLYGRHEVKRK